MHAFVEEGASHEEAEGDTEHSYDRSVRTQEKNYLLHHIPSSSCLSG